MTLLGILPASIQLTLINLLHAVSREVMIAGPSCATLAAALVTFFKQLT